MPSSKGKPTDPQKREEARKEVLQMDKGGGKGSWSAWKAGEMAKRYEAKGGDYEESGDNPNKAEKGDPQPKGSAVKKGERKSKDAPVGATKQSTKANANKEHGGGKKTKSSRSQTKTPAKKGTRTQPKRGSRGDSKVATAAA